MSANRTSAVLVFASVGSALIIAYQVAAKAARDAIFLSTFPITSLPLLVIVSALFSMLLMFFISSGMRRLGPFRLLPPLFWLSALVHVAEWLLFRRFKTAVAIMLYLHLAGLGALLISGFWSLVSECFDPHTAKERISRIVGAGSLGAIGGGVLAERITYLWNAPALLAALALVHFAAGWAVTGMHPPALANAGEPGGTGLTKGLRVLAGMPYLRHLGMLMLLGSAGAAMLDYVFKAQIQAGISSPGGIQRFFAIYYMVVSLAGFLLQTTAAKYSLKNGGLGITISALPAAITFGSLGASLAPGLFSATAARGAEHVARNSLFRSAYEQFYTPVMPEEKRSAKPLIDVGLDRLGDLLGNAGIRCLLWMMAGAARPAILAVATAVGSFALWFASRLDAGYSEALENSLRCRALTLKLEETGNKTTYTTLVRVIGQLASPAPKVPRQPADPVIRRIENLRSADPGLVRGALEEAPLTAELTAHAIALLARDDVALDAIAALQRVAPLIGGQLTDALLDPRQDFAIRRRIPGILSNICSHRAVEALALGLEDKRFEVRFRCAKALASLVERDPRLSVGEPVVLDAISRELQVERLVWESYRLLDGDDGAELLGERTGRGRQHVFTLLSLILPREPLWLSYRALQTDDGLLRGTALEYLESVLPGTLQQKLWPYLDDRRTRERPARSREDIVADLLRSHQSIEIALGKDRPATAGF
ncbi:MAG: hypothetical protein U0Q18_03085 [Bryobacteraceae bacterium]